jgi:hypothetical protein
MMMLRLLVLSTFLFSTSCSRLDLAVSWADNYMASLVDDYFDLSSSQNKELKESLRQDIAKVRRSQFKTWADFLRRIEKDLKESKLSPDAIQSYFTEGQREGRKLPSEFVETAVKFVGTLKPEQLVHFDNEMKQKDLEREEKLKDPVKAKKELRKKYLNGIELWIDSLSSEQLALLDKHLEEHPFPQKEQLKNRISVTKKFREAQKSTEDLQKFVRAYYSDSSQFWEPDYKKALESYQRELQKWLVVLVGTLSDRQKKQLSENLLEKASALEKLALSK